MHQKYVGRYGVYQMKYKIVQKQSLYLPTLYTDFTIICYTVSSMQICDLCISNNVQVLWTLFATKHCKIIYTRLLG
jgi:hypothetical protein